MQQGKVEYTKTLSAMTSTDLGFHVEKIVLRQLERSHKAVTKADEDRVFIIDGREGTGKSTLALQLAKTLDPSFDLKQVVFNADDFESIGRSSDHFKAVVFDEAFNGLSSKGALSKQNKKLIRLLMECRQRNLFIFIVLPSLFMLEKYVAIFRAQALFHVFKKKGTLNQRFYKIYNYNQKKLLYLMGKQMLNYNRPRIPLTHRFYGKYPDTISRDEYIKKKMVAFRDEDKKKVSEDRFKVQRDKLIYDLRNKFGFKTIQIKKMLEESGFAISSSHLSQLTTTVPPSVDS